MRSAALLAICNRLLPGTLSRSGRAKLRTSILQNVLTNASYGASPIADGTAALMINDVFESWFPGDGAPRPFDCPALDVPTNDPLIKRFIREFPFGGKKALSLVMEARPGSAKVRAAWARVEALYAGHPDWLHAIRAADSDPLDGWAMRHRARLLADLTELGGRPTSGVITYDELRELAYTVATMADEQARLTVLLDE